jgi:hypothetical protein
MGKYRAFANAEVIPDLEGWIWGRCGALFREKVSPAPLSKSHKQRKHGKIQGVCECRGNTGFGGWICGRCSALFGKKSPPRPFQKAINKVSMGKYRAFAIAEVIPASEGGFGEGAVRFSGKKMKNIKGTPVVCLFAYKL